MQVKLILPINMTTLIIIYSLHQVQCIVKSTTVSTQEIWMAQQGKIYIKFQPSLSILSHQCYKNIAIDEL